MKIGYFPGCTLKTKAVGLDDSVRDTAVALGHELVEVPDWTCCGATFSLAADNVMALAGPVRILANARKVGDKVVTVCAGCYNVLKRANYAIRHDEEKRKKVNDFNEMEYDGDVEVLHYLEFLRDHVGFDKIARQVKRDLSSLKVVPYYGCQMLRPEEELGFDDPEAPMIMDNLLDAIGCEVLDFPHKAECCGAFLTVCSDVEARSGGKPEAAQGAVSECSYTILKAAEKRGADLVVLTCPLCHYNLDSTQEAIEKRHYGFGKIPIVYFTQLLALALGLDASRYALDNKHHYVDPTGVLKAKVTA
ncbi:MAG: CoB--CoM heterodisulfide reductase iron-sulfur subunit B family protein [bacterium]